jgi:hypothetical protein
MSERATTPSSRRRAASAPPRTARAAAAATLALLTLVTGAAPAAQAAAPAAARAAASSAVEPSGVTVVDVPYRSEIDVSPAEGWTIADCGAITAPEGIGIACEPTTLTFSAAEFDPALERQDVRVPLTTGRTTLEVVYRVGLAPPEPPTVPSRAYPTPFAQGSRVLIPLSDLGVLCTLCGAENGPTVTAVGVKPVRAGTLSVTSTHLVFAAAPDFAGDAEVTVRATDDLDQESTDATLTISLYASGPSTLLALHTVMATERDGTTAIDLSARVATRGGGAPRITGGGAARRGAVVCRPDGTAEFRSTDAPVDQFSFSVVTPDGEQATGSVTLVSGALATAPTPGLADARGETAAQTVVPARVPVEDAPEAETSPFDPLKRLLDRVDG